MIKIKPQFLSNLFHLVYVLALSCLFLTSCSSSKKLTSQIDETLEEVPAFDTGFSGIMVYDPEAEKIVYQHNSEKYFTPASNTKLFTYYAGLKTLGDSIPALKYSVHNDSLVFWGTGDPSFLHRKFPDSEVLDFLKERKEQLFYALPKYKEEHFGPGWSWDDYNWYYSAERGAFPVYGNYAFFEFDPQKPEPRIVPSYFENSVEADSSYAGSSSVVYRDRMKNNFLFRHRPGNEEDEQEVPFVYSEELVVELLQDTLNRKVELIQEVPEHFGPTRTLYSIPADSLYKRMLQVSDNFIAEQILLMSAQAVSDTLKADIAIDYMKENHLKDLPDEPIWIDGSGLSTYNKFTPRSIVKLLEKIKEEVPQDVLFEMLPAGGESGTIKNWYKAEEPYIYAKTGTLSNAHMLSGYLKTKSGKVLIFSFMNNNYTVPSAEIKRGMEKILRNIYQNY